METKTALDFAIERLESWREQLRAGVKTDSDIRNWVAVSMLLMPGVGAPSAESPRHPHDCDKCIFLGLHREYDLYYCDNTFRTVIARYGEESDYLSGVHGAYHVEPLYEALKRSFERGLVSREYFEVWSK